MSALAKGRNLPPQDPENDNDDAIRKIINKRRAVKNQPLASRPFSQADMNGQLNLCLMAAELFRAPMEVSLPFPQVNVRHGPSLRSSLVWSTSLYATSAT